MGLVYTRAGTLLTPSFWTGQTIKGMLVLDTYSPNRDHQFVSDIVASELGSVSGYVPGFGQSGRHTLGGKSTAVDNASNQLNYIAGNPSWPALAAGHDILGVALIRENTNDADSDLIALVTTADGLAVTTDGRDFALLFPGGIAVELGAA